LLRNDGYAEKNDERQGHSGGTKTAARPGAKNREQSGKPALLRIENIFQFAPSRSNAIPRPREKRMWRKSRVHATLITLRQPLESPSPLAHYCVNYRESI
jgi:hypothetical protein